ncbi:hypothetical protein Ancab_026681 [Ancistrocladus abbreviatus]
MPAEASSFPPIDPTTVSHFSLSLPELTCFLNFRSTTSTKPTATTFDDSTSECVSYYVEFKSIDASFIYDGNRNLSSMPDTQSAIFNDRSLGLTENNQLVRFFELLQEHLEVVASRQGDEGESGEGRMIAEED